MGNTASTEALLWSLASIIALLAVLGTVVYFVHRYGFFYGEAKAVEASYKLLQAPVTPSQRSCAKYFLVAGLLFLVQIFNGGLLAHYTVHPGTFYIEFIGQIYAYSWAKSWHLQLAILWIALSWMGTAIYLAPLVAGREPKGQRAMVNILFVAAFTVTVGSLLGEVLGIKGYLGDAWFWLGHQGWEYLELGRLWQILLFGGLIFWLVVVYRAIGPVLKVGARETAEAADRRALVTFYVFSAIFVVAFFGFGLLYSRGTHLTIADYWRWFVVHIWVESIFEFFGVAVISLFLVTLGLVTARSALRVAYFTAILVFIAGIPGTAHHYFWFGGPGFWLGIGGVFSSLEPIPLILLVVRAWMEYRSIRAEGKEFPYRWPLYFLTASSVWNFVGAGMFGFLINLPIINYYEHATYLTSNHGHTALFGVYGMLAIALILFSWRGLVENRYWNDSLLKLSFWGLNGGLFLMFLTGLLPIGLYQVWYSYDVGFWFARSAAFYDLPVIQALGTWRMVPDTIIIVLGAFPLLYFLIKTFPRLRQVGSLGGKR
jgi:nitric oxide reductase subunit B